MSRGMEKKRWVKGLVGRDAVVADSGEKIGVVTKEVLGGDGTVIGYEVSDKESDSTIYFPAEQTIAKKNGLIIQPLWYTETMKFVKQLELQESLMPEIAEISKDVSGNALYKMLSDVDPKLIKLSENGTSIKKSVEEKLSHFSSEAAEIREQIVKATGEHLLEGTGRKELAEEMLKLRRRAKIVKVNINKCNELLLRLRASPFLVKAGLREEGYNKASFPIEGTGGIVCPYKDTCPIIHRDFQKIKGKETEEMEARPFRVVKMDAMRKKLEDEAKKIREDMKKELMAELGIIKTQETKKEPVEKEEKPVEETKKKKGLRTKTKKLAEGA